MERDFMNRNEFIAQHLKLAKFIANQYYSMHRNPEGAIGAAVLELCEMSSDVLDRNLTIEQQKAFVILRVKTAVRSFIAADYPIKVSHPTFFKNLSEGKLPRYEPMQDTIVTDCPYRKDAELKQLCEDLHLCERDNLILQMRLAGNTDDEIGDLLNLQRSRISQLRKEIGRQVIKLLEDDKHTYKNYR